MKLTLNTPKITTTTIIDIVILSINHDLVRNEYVARYAERLADETIIKKGTFRLIGEEDISAFFLELDALIIDPHTYLDKVQELIFSKIDIGVIIKD